MSHTHITPSRKISKYLTGIAAALCLLGTAGCATDPNEARGRSLGTMVDDTSIEFSVSDGIKKADPFLKDARIIVTSYNGAVLLTGQTPNADLRQKAAQAAARQNNVRQVYNELTVAPNATLSVRTSDSLLTTKVKSQLWAQESIKDSKMKVITEGGTVYLLGIVSQQQSDLAAKVTQEIDGVQKIVRLFEIIN